MPRFRDAARQILISLCYLYYTLVYKMDIARTAKICVGAKLDKTNPKGVHIGEYTYVASGSTVFSHDFARCLTADTYIGKMCFIGSNAIIMPGVRIGDHVVIGAGAVVTRDIPSNTIAVGNPARVIKTGIMTRELGRIVALGNALNRS
jgi:acetyltransferase-like isoleucine patch superfamily enzyme